MIAHDGGAGPLAGPTHRPDAIVHGGGNGRAPHEPVERSAMVVRGGGHGVALHESAQLRLAIVDARRQIAASVVALREKASLALSWRAWVRRRPGLAVGVALAVGLLAGTMHRRR